MSSQLYKVFEEVERKATLLSRYWHNFYVEVSQHLPESYQPEMKQLSSHLEQALENLVQELRNPVLTLATTGTTSSGKSTLVNLLCGAEIVPVAVSEMSAGAVTIEYNDIKSLTIHKTPGALWECGEWKNIGEDEIYQRLYQAMINFIDNRIKNPNLACPQSTISYPFRLLKETKLELPRDAKVRIMDLPGLAYVGDEGNASVIRQCREALCIVTYNSAENDPMRIKSLLKEVVEQVKDLGGSPARMLFALNRIDVFRADRNWPETEERFIEGAIANIKGALTEQLKEYTKEIENLQVVRLSTWPALLSLQVKSPDVTTSVEACRKTEHNFYGLIADVLADLHRNPQQWSEHDRGRVAKALWESSYAEDFHRHLREHIVEHFPQLVIPQALERFNVLGGNKVAEWAKQTTTAILNSSEEQYQQECENIALIRSSIEHFLETSNRTLREPFEALDEKLKSASEEGFDEDNDYIDDAPVRLLESTISKLKEIERYNLLGDKLYPLYGWRRELGLGINQILEAVAESLETGTIDLENSLFKKANHLNVNLLERNLSRLIGLGYTGSIASDGKSIEAKSDEEKKELKQLNDELNELAIHLNIVMEDVLNQISNQELDRMYQAVVELFNCELSYLENGCNEHAPNLAIKFPESQLIKVEGKPEINLKFQSGFAVTEGTWQDLVQEAAEKRVWWKLWLGKATVYESRYETRSSDNAEVPGVRGLLSGWIAQAKEAESEIVNQILQWLLEQVDHLKKNVNQVQDDIIDRYQARLDKANQEITFDYENQKGVWQPISLKAQKLAEEFDDLGNILKLED